MKRFKAVENSFDIHIEDTYYTEDKHEHNIYGIYKLCEKLNELEEENQKLKNNQNFEIYVTYKKDEKHECVIKTTNDENLKIVLSQIDYVKINNKTGIVSVNDFRIDNLKIKAKKVNIYLDPILLGKYYDLIIENKKDFTIIKLPIKENQNLYI